MEWLAHQFLWFILEVPGPIYIVSDLGVDGTVVVSDSHYTSALVVYIMIRAS